MSCSLDRLLFSEQDSHDLASQDFMRYSSSFPASLLWIAPTLEATTAVVNSEERSSRNYPCQALIPGK